MSEAALKASERVCRCGYHFPLCARSRIEMLCDKGSFNELFGDITPKNTLDFPDYDEKLRVAAAKSGEKESVICGESVIRGQRCALFVMEMGFMMGSMGAATGEKITRLFEYAQQNSLPVLGVTLSGGARMQEGILSLMQMAKISAAVKRHSDAGNLYIVLLTDPTTGGVTASFAMQGDIILAEPYALVGFAGPRVIEQTIGKKLPDEFQKSEFLLEHGFIDNIAPRGIQKDMIGRILAMHSREAG